MAFLHLDATGQLDEDQAKAAAQGRAAEYAAAQPFPHIVIDDFLPGDVLHRVLEEFPTTPARQFDRAQEKLKSQYHPRECSPAIRALFAELNSQGFLRFLKALTGIRGLVPDPYFNGGGLHETQAGGKLGIHADFNVHPVMKLQRRLNLLIYLNEDWDDEFGGKLELWDRAMTRCETSIAPVFGRAVIFDTDLDSYHGHPDPLACPPDRSRRSIATYYYTAFAGSEGAVRSKTTGFRRRPGSDDRRAVQSALKDIWLDWAPPALQRQLARRKGED